MQVEGVFLSAAEQLVCTWAIWVVGAVVLRAGGSGTLMGCEVMKETGPWVSPKPSSWEKIAGQLEDILEVAVRLECILVVAEAPERNPVSWEGSCTLDWWESWSPLVKAYLRQRSRYWFSPLLKKFSKGRRVERSRKEKGRGGGGIVFTRDNESEIMLHVVLYKNKVRLHARQTAVNATFRSNCRNVTAAYYIINNVPAGIGLSDRRR